jgi:propanol-preferring alcohol dehydrogenase
MTKVARWAHARKVIAVDVMASKFETCLKAGADATVDASDGRITEQLMELTAGRGVDVAIDFVGKPEVLEAACAALGKGGRLVALAGQGTGFRIDREAQRKEAEIMGSRYATRQEVMDALDLVARGEIWPMVTEKVPLAQAEAVHQRLDKGLVTGRAALMIG